MNVFHISLICFFILNDTDAWHPRIIGGKRAKKGDFPYVAAVALKPEPQTYQLMCTSSIISKRWLVAAAHCKVERLITEESVFYPKSTDYIVIVGEVLVGKSSPSYAVEEFHPHPEYSANHLLAVGNDIAVIKLKDYLVWSFYVTPILLGAIQDENQVSVLTAGFGLRHPDGDEEEVMSLNYIKMKTVKFESCEAHYRKWAYILNKTLAICANEIRIQSTCQGDSGGPLVDFESRELVGVLNGVLECSGEYPSVYARVSHHIPWINNQTGLHF